MRFTYDTNIFIRYNPVEFPAAFFMSAVVVQELTAGALDESQVRRYGTVRQQFEASGRLLVPNGEDWWMAGKILNALRRGLPSRRPGRAVVISKEEQQRIVRDVLIAKTAQRAHIAVVTENVVDFEKIRRFCNVKVVPAAEFF